ncbi:MAG TPA: class I SAM-dependent methyltransferase [Kofleriaceae bacterium]|nr:class I SAM-dependent methyltransferase [Kofleriaceae bacterium]
MVEHRVLDHLGLAAADYDAAIRRYIPHYDALIATIVELVDGDVTDLGTGTGALAAAILTKPSTRVRLVDIDPAMLSTAASRVAPFGDRATCVRASFDEGLAPCDAVVASFALHHVPTLEAKRSLYARIHAALRPGGILAIGDVTIHDDGPANTTMMNAWAAWMSDHGIARADANALFAKWAGEDRYFSLADELATLAAAGFSRPDCFWKHGPSTVFGAYR